MLGDVETFGEKGLREAHGLSVAWGVWGAVLWGVQVYVRPDYRPLNRDIPGNGQTRKLAARSPLRLARFTGEWFEGGARCSQQTD